ncbi:hypothetical protein LAZ40_03355 [Cereibacter sphaeroides]|uniref:hypothetical protein n=1 Tax=Cereibacter sphaeroides TaxID=1063 RepID=UPI001F3185D7|nr:hypothetical protein [Cereibacter sphaeroides]MCE6958093.1 hypothetical protein [Cereibacter sphaeroides]MCE6971420.1 hypothetical protein [Cereibacter sphaeroides]
MKMKLLPVAAVAALLPVLAAAQDAAAPETEPSADPGAVALVQDPTDETFVPFRCPIEKIRDAYQNLVDPEDTLVALAIEKQTLAICRQSQEALIRIAENEARLTELFEPIIAPPAPVPPPQPEVAADLSAGAGTERLPDTAAADEAIPEVGADPAGMADAEPEVVPPPFALAAVMKDPQGWKAMLMNGDAVSTVRVGDTLEDGSTVAGITRDKVELRDASNHSFFLE